MSDHTQQEAAASTYGGVLILRNVSTGLLEYQRTPTVFTPIKAVTYKGAEEKEAWKPTAGKRWRFMGLTLSGTVTTKVELLDAEKGKSFLAFSVGTAGVNILLPGNGRLATLVTTGIWLLNGTESVLTGTLYGTEE